MQPFSLLPFLQSLMQNLPDHTTSVSPEQNVDETQTPPPDLQEKASEKNACWEFLSRHDERVKRTKKAP